MGRRCRALASSQLYISVDQVYNSVVSTWDDFRYVLALSRQGNLSAAARSLGVSQPTMGRRVAACERRLGTRLFHRERDGFSMTPAGTAILASLERMETHAVEIERATAGRDEGLRGLVRITASEWIATRVLAPALAPLLARNHELVVDLVADPRHLNLGRREADLAIRPRRFEHQTVYQRRLGRIELGLYGSHAYVAHHPTFGDRGAGHALIAMAEDVGDIARAWLADHADRARVVATTNGREQMAALAAAGVGLACLPRIMGDAVPSLRRVEPQVALPSRTLWLGVHRDMRELPRVRATIAALVSAIPVT
jgi:DNA-binding transcriptional LysR family regulator